MTNAEQAVPTKIKYNGPSRKRTDIKILAPFYDGGIGLGELILTGLETPAFIPLNNIATGGKNAGVQPVGKARSPEVPKGRAAKYLPWAVGVTALGGAYYFFALRKK